MLVSVKLAKILKLFSLTNFFFQLPPSLSIIIVLVINWYWTCRTNLRKKFIFFSLLFFKVCSVEWTLGYFFSKLHHFLVSTFVDENNTRHSPLLFSPSGSLQLSTGVDRHCSFCQNSRSVCIHLLFLSNKESPHFYHVVVFTTHFQETFKLCNKNI